MYNLAAYGEMIAEPVRRQAYVEALERAVRPGCTVLDLGTGPGFFAMVAARLGAAKVYGVDPSPSIELAPRLAEINGLGERLEFRQGSSTELELPEKVDVVVSDLRGVLPLFQGHIPAIVDARERLLAPGGVLIPRRDQLWAALVEAEETHRRLTHGWQQRPLGLDLSLGLERVTNGWAKQRLEPGQCLVEAQRWAVLDYRSVNSCDVSGRLQWQMERSGTTHGLAVWFDADLGGGTGFSNAPDQPDLIYGQAFFPFPEPANLYAGDRVTVELRAVKVGRDYVWSWATAIRGDSGDRRFEQSTFFGEPLAPGGLRKHAGDYLPALDEGGQIVRWVLSRMDGQTPLEEIARELRAAFPAAFEHWRDALTRVGQLSERYG